MDKVEIGCVCGLSIQCLVDHGAESAENTSERTGPGCSGCASPDSNSRQNLQKSARIEFKK